MKAQWSKLFVVTVAFLLLAGACAAPPPPAPPAAPPTATPVPPTPTPDPTAPVKVWVDALNSGDVDAMSALFTDDAQYQLFFDATGKEELRGVFNWLVGLKAKNEIVDCQQSQSDRVMCDLTVVDDCIAAFGAPEGLAAKGVYLFREDGKIQQVAGAQEGAGWDDYWKWVDDMFAWQRTNRAEESAKADYSFGKDGAAVQLKLCKEYEESLKVTPAATSDLAAPVQAWVDAINNNNTEAALALVSDDVKWQGVFEATGKEELRAVVDWMIGIESKPQITDCQSQGDRVVCNLTALDGCKAAFGASSLRSKLVFIYQPDGKVQQASLEPDGEEWAGYWSWLEAETAWAAANRAEEHAKVGTAPNQREAGSIQIKLCKEYGESLKATPAAGATPIPSTSAPSSDLEKLAMAYQDAFNRHAAEGALALFIDQGFSYFDVEFTAHDKETLRDKLEYDFGLGATLEFPNCGPKGEALRCTELWRNEYCLKAMCGFDVWHNEVIFKPKDGKIQFMSFTASPEDGKACGEAYPKYVAWASANRPEEWKKLNAPAAYDLKGRPLGELASGVCKAYLDSQK